MTVLVKPTECMKRRFFVCLILASLALSLVGAGKITTVINERRERKERFNQVSEVWVEKIAAELSENEREGWQAPSEEVASDMYIFIQ